jgi:hypothetical protein
VETKTSLLARQMLPLISDLRVADLNRPRLTRFEVTVTAHLGHAPGQRQRTLVFRGNSDHFLKNAALLKTFLPKAARLLA